MSNRLSMLCNHRFVAVAICAYLLSTNVWQPRSAAGTPLGQATAVEVVSHGVTTYTDHTTLGPLLVGIEPVWNSALCLTVDTKAVDEATYDSPSTTTKVIVTVIGKDVRWCHFLALEAPGVLPSEVEGTELARTNIEGP